MSNEIVIRPAGADTPGFLRRMRTALALQERMLRGDPQALDEMVDFIVESADEVTVPDGVDPRDAILDLSQNDFQELFSVVSGNDQTVDPPNAG